MDKGTKIALGLGAAAGVGAFVFWPKDAKASSAKSSDDVGKAIADAAAKGCTEGAADKLAGKPSKVALTTGFETPTTAQQAYDKAYTDCYKLGTIPVTGSTDKKPVVVVESKKPATIAFDPSKANNPARAHNLAIAIGHSPPTGMPANKDGSVGCNDPLAIGGRSYCTLQDFGSYGPNRAAVVAFQEAAGLTPDGNVGGPGSNTTRAFYYWFDHGSTGTAGMSGTLDAKDTTIGSIGGTVTGTEV